MIARSWFRRIRLCTSDAEVFEALRFLECNPEIPGEPAEDIAFQIEPYRSYYRIAKDGRAFREQMTPQGVAHSLHAELISLSLDDFPVAPLIHAASLRREGRRILLVGQKGGGKTTLTLQLIQEGYEIEGDENVFVTSDGVVARPRGMRVKESTLSFFPHLAENLRSAPYYQSGQDLRIYNLDPRQAGATFWRIEPGPVDMVLLLRPNHGGHSSVRTVSSLALVREVMMECALPQTGRSAAIAAITKTIGNTRGFDLSLGNLDQAVGCLDQIFAENA